MRQKYTFTTEEREQISFSNEITEKAVVGYFLFKNGFQLGDDWDKGWILDYDNWTVEFEGDNNNG